MLRVFGTIVCTLLHTIHACNGIAFRGGGSFGAVEVGLFSKVLQEYEINDINVMTGISAGGLNVGFLASQIETNSTIEDATSELRDIYASLTNKDIYSFNPLKSFTSWSLYQTDLLNTTIHNILSTKNQIINAPKTLIGTSNLMTGMLDIIDYNELQTVNEKTYALMSTSAIPFVFPPINWNGTIYVDGGLISNEMIFQGLEYLTCSTPTIWYFEPSVSISPISKITGFLQFSDRILNIVSNGFDNQLQKILISPERECFKKSIKLQLCHPNSIGIEKLQSYSILDFGYGKQLFEIGFETVECDLWQLCI